MSVIGDVVMNRVGMAAEQLFFSCFQHFLHNFYTTAHEFVVIMNQTVF